MLSLQQAIEIKESIKSYLQATFTFRKREVAEAFEAFIDRPALGMFKGPYVSLKLRFVKANSEAVAQIPLTIKPNWPPYDHQVKSWTRLSTLDKKPEPTIVTTGTGSGKTESFLYPVLDYCYHQQHRPGIKVVILYPMNALATDQAKRLAEMIHEDVRLRGKITAGLFIGEGNGPKGQFPKSMGENHIIEHRDSILDSPPDILLTNFKMLDYALMKHNYHKLWAYNFNDPSLFQFLVLDELHTYDGAQGTDVANLIRRMKLKLKMTPGQLCAVGTSATMGSGIDAPQLLADYATKIFGEEITPEALITENRITAEDFFGEDDFLNDFIPLPSRLRALVFHESEDYDDYIQSHLDVWQQDKKQLAGGLIQLKIVKDLILAINKGKGTKTVEEIIRDLSILNESYRKLAQWDEKYEYNPKERVLESLLTLIASAKDIDNPRSPFMYLQVQLWIRELSGVQYTLENPAQFSFRDQVDANQEIAALPPWYCRECNSSGWLGVKPENRDAFSKDINEVYEKYFSKNKNVYFLLPKKEMTPEDFQAIGYVPDDFLEENINPIRLDILGKEEEGFGIQAVRKLRENRIEHICPCCNTSNSVAIIGTKIPTLSSIAVSQTLATDLDPATDKFRKVLAFTNSVQDAAHQAGFIEGRNYRFTFRASVQKVINTLNRPVRLDELANEFITYWKAHGDETGNDSLNGYLYRFFPKDYIGKASPKDFLTNGIYSKHFLKEFDSRVQWELYSEFGFSSRIGRTLEKTGASSVYFDPKLLQQVWDEVSDWVSENDVSNSINQDVFVRFTNLILHRIRSRGAIDHAFLSKFRTDRLNLWDLNWQKDSRHFLNPHFGEFTRFPKILTNQQSKRNLLDTTKAKTTNWFHAYFRKSFTQTSLTIDFVNEFYEEWTKSLVKVGILNYQKAGDHENYAISPKAVFVNKNVKEYRCNECEGVIYSHDDEIFSSHGSCLNYRCTGAYELESKTNKNYYKAVYNRNRFPRVYAREHTGLLERKVREKLEIDFKNRERFNDANTLIATSTLEMGIDIGSLNTAYNNSIPPLPSNFLQRVGRAGRSSGAALIVNFAKNQNHDLYYYADPLEMMQGDVNTPGCYLEAKDILKRHFTAYCFDCLTTENSIENTIPTFIRDLKLNARDLTGEDFFINRLNLFIEKNRFLLVHEFLKQYDNEIGENVFVEIELTLDSGSFYDELLNVFIRIKNELFEIDKRRIDLNKEIKTLNIAKGDPVFEEYTREKRNLNGIKKSIAARNILEHLTNVGVLPNYAFPETGVRLNAHVLSSKVEGSTSIGLDKDFELVRPATQAIKELAPENFFYTQGFRFEITGVNTFDWSDQNNFHVKRFCSKCDHLENNSLASKGNCPKCGDPSWASASNVHTFAKMTSVKSFSNSSRATLTDSSDDRDSHQYQVLQHVLLDSKSSEGAWVLKDIPFGIEYVKNVTITSVNYGRTEGNDARRIKVNDTEALTKGFVTCKHCGKSASATHLLREAKDYHFGYCKHRDVKYQPGIIDVFEEIYFFREMKTEVLKIVLPIQEFNSEEDIRMFQAGLELGLKKYFKGNPGHIRIQSYREFNQKTDKFDRFLLLYDTIPGGTGYLKQLFDHSEFSLFLKESYEAIRDCSCQLDGHDGCYKCIYSYGNQYNRSDLSRARAESWFGKIYEKTEEWIKNDLGLTSLTNSGKIEESELEERFIKLLKVFAEQSDKAEFLSKKQDGTVYYELRINQGDIEAHYWIRPQINLGPKDGIAYSTRTDFLIVCGSYLYKGKDYKYQVPKIAIYLDGYQYHASLEHNVFERDVNIRKSIALQPEFRTWTLTWKDLDVFQKIIEGDNGVADELATIFNANYLSNYNKLISTVIDDERINYALPNSNFQRLWQQLETPQISLFEKSWYTYLGSWTTKLLEPSFDPSSLDLLLSKELSFDSYIKNNRIKDFDGLIPLEVEVSYPFIDWKSWVNIRKKDIFNQVVVKNTSIIDKQEWEKFWHIFNLFQSGSFVASKNNKTIIVEVDEIDLFLDLESLYESYLHRIIKEAIEKGIITIANSEFLDSWVDDDGNILADAELVLSSAKIAINPNSAESTKIFEKGGFSIYSIDEINNITL
ncbi:DEAD/DEAH box helicase [Lacinutrix sp. MEBiC02404]